MPELVELKQNREFLEPNFPGYKLSLTKIPGFTINISSPVHCKTPSNEQYTYKHAKLFALHNYILAYDYDALEDTESIYCISEDRQIHRIRLDLLGLEEIIANWKVPQVNPNHDYNFTMKFQQEYVVVSDGSGSIYFLNRTSNDWKCIHNDTLSFGFVILDCKLRKNSLHLLLFHIEHVRESNEELKHISVLNWIEYEHIAESWDRKFIKEMKSNSELNYALFDNAADAIYLCSNEGQFVHKSFEQTPLNIMWCQNTDSVTIYISASEIVTSKNGITIKQGDRVIVDEELFEEIDSSLTTWTRSKDQLIILLTKQRENLQWPQLFKHQPHLGEELPDENNAKKAHDKLERLSATYEAESIPTKAATITDQVEECDFTSSDGSLLERIVLNGSELKISHKVILTQELVFVQNNLMQFNENDPVFAIQQNEDICLYKPQMTELNHETLWHLQHIATLYAFAYIRASKQRRKFTLSSPDLSYAAIAESSKHIFIYKQNVHVVNGELRNRQSGKHVTQLAQQQVIELNKEEDILGIFASNQTLFVLTSTKVFAYNMK